MLFFYILSADDNELFDISIILESVVGFCPIKFCKIVRIHKSYVVLEDKNSFHLSKLFQAASLQRHLQLTSLLQRDGFLSLLAP